MYIRVRCTYIYSETYIHEYKSEMYIYILIYMPRPVYPSEMYIYIFIDIYL